MTKQKVMSPKGFLAKATRPNVSAAAFLAAHRDYMTTGELASILSPVLHKVDTGELLPTPALNVIATAVMGHIIASDIQKLDDKVNNPPEAAKPKPWITTIYNAAGVIQTRINPKGEVEDLVKGFEMGQEADRWADRRLFEGASDWYAEVANAKVNLMNRVERSEAIARILKQPKGPSIHQKAATTKSLGFGVRAKQDRSSFSRG